MALAAYLARAVPIVEAEAVQILRLRRPSQSAPQRAQLDRYLSALRAERAAYRQLADAALGSDGAALARAESALRSNDSATLAVAYGILSCGAPGATIR